MTLCEKHRKLVISMPNSESEYSSKGGGWGCWWFIDLGKSDLCLRLGSGLGQVRVRVRLGSGQG